MFLFGLSAVKTQKSSSNSQNVSGFKKNGSNPKLVLPIQQFLGPTGVVWVEPARLLPRMQADFHGAERGRAGPSHHRSLGLFGDGPWDFQLESDKRDM